MDAVLKELSKNERAIIYQLLRLYRTADERAEGFRRQTGIRCPENCGFCCKNYRVETTALEMLPLALDLWARDEAEIWLKKIDAAEDKDICVFFEPAGATAENGRCRIYPLRPLICRLFGFFAIKDKYGGYVYAGCKIIKQACPGACSRVKTAIERGRRPSAMTDFSIQILSMGSGLGTKMLPVNTAAGTAIEKIGLALSFKRRPPGPPGRRAA